MTTTPWIAVITDENRRRAFYDYEPAREAATFADDMFSVAIARGSALPDDDGGGFIPRTAWSAVDVAHEIGCPLIDDTDDELSLRACFERAQVMAAALNAAQTVTA